MERALWIIGGGVVVAAITVAVALVALKRDEIPEEPGVTEALIGAQGQAQDRAAQATLRNALAAAKVYFVDNQTYTGWDPSVGAEIEPALAWAGDDRASEGVVNINFAGADQVLMSTMSASGQAFCIGDAVFGGGTNYGRMDAAGATDAGACVGGW